MQIPRNMSLRFTKGSCSMANTGHMKKEDESDPCGNAEMANIRTVMSHLIMV